MIKTREKCQKEKMPLCNNLAKTKYKNHKLSENHENKKARRML